MWIASKQEVFAMRFLILAAVLLVSACASNAPGNIRGSHEKSSWIAMDKYVNSDARYVQPDAARCKSGTILYCTTRGKNSSCSCVFEHDISASRKQTVPGKTTKILILYA
jgi:starvation-inducible outer membrane lipoprotein